MVEAASGEQTQERLITAGSLLEATIEEDIGKWSVVSSTQEWSMKAGSSLKATIKEDQGKGSLMSS